MHIPDNFLSTPVWATLDVVAAPLVAIVSRRARTNTETSRLPLLGVMGAFVFAAQMVNFPIAAGTSGHLVGGTLLACVLGPEAAMLTVSAILIIQSLVFQDGGVLALGANILNMAFAGVLVGYLPYSCLRQSRWKSYAVFFGAVLSVMVSGILALAELRLSGIQMPPGLVVLSLLLFLGNAIMEGAITTTVLKAVTRLNPEVAQETASASRIRPAFAIGLCSVVLASAGYLLASSRPDGLEHLAERLGLPLNAQPVIHSPLADYQMSAFGDGPFSKVAAGFLGLVLIYSICLLGGRLLERAKRTYSS